MCNLAKITTIAALTISTNSFAISTTDLAHGVAPNDLVGELIDTTASNITYSNITYKGANDAAGIFAGADADGLGINKGILLSTGRISNAIGPNKCYKTTTVNGQPGEPQLGISFDAAALEFDFIPTSDKLEFQYVFASEEYNEFVNSNYNDVFAFFLDGQNIALIPGTATEVAINSVNLKSNSPSYHDNAYPISTTSWNDYFRNPCQAGQPTPFQTEFDGFTTVLKATANVVPGHTHHLKLVIADRGDYSLDSAVFIQGKSFKSPPPPPPPPPPAPAQVSLVSPQGTGSERKLSYTWNAVANATQYKLKVDGANGQALAQSYTIADASCATGTGICAVTPPTELPDSDYQWWIQASNNSGDGLWSEAMSFKVEIIPPPPPPLPVTTCQLYAVNDQERSDSQFLVIDPQTRAVTSLGENYPAADIEALTAHPVTKELYAASSGDATSDAGALYKVNPTNGAFTLLGRLSLADGSTIDDVEGLSFHPDTNQLWGWAQGQGLFKVDVNNLPTAELKWSSKDTIEDLTWNAEGTALYLGNRNQLIRYDGIKATPVCTFPKGKRIESLVMTPDGLLLLGIHDEHPLYLLDPKDLKAGNASCQTKPFEVSASKLDLEGMAWVCTTKVVAPK